MLDSEAVVFPERETREQRRDEHLSRSVDKLPAASNTSTFDVQRRAVVGAANDPAEVAADRVADQIVRALSAQLPAPASPGAVDDPGASGVRGGIGRRVQRSATASARPGAVISSAPRIRRAAATVGAAGGVVDADTDRRIQRASGGAGMPAPMQQSMEHAFDADFSEVRVHADSESRELNSRIQASAFTAGNHVWFRDGMPDISRQGDQHLVAHELAHVVQQGAGTARRTMRGSADATLYRKGRRGGRGGKGGEGPGAAPVPLSLDDLKVERTRVAGEKAALEQQIATLEATVRANVLSKTGDRSTKDRLQNKLLEQLRKKLQALDGELGRVDGEITPLQQAKNAQTAEEQRVAEEQRLAAEQQRLAAEQQRLAAEQQARTDAATKPYSWVADRSLADLAGYVTVTPDWGQHSSMDDAKRALVAAVAAFAADPANQAPCAAFTTASMQAAAESIGWSLRNLIRMLPVYVRAAGDQRDPFEVSVTSSPEEAALSAWNLRALLADFPRWVLAGAMEEKQLNALIEGDYVDDLIAYYKYQVPPIFQAEEGADFAAYLEMRDDDGVDPASFQGGPLSAYVRNFHRFEASALQGLLANLTDTSKTKPLTLVLHSALDHNGAFHRDPNVTSVITNSKNLTIMVEGGASIDDYKAQITPIARAYGNNDKIDQVMFAGHGGSRTIDLAGTVAENTVDVDVDGTIQEVNSTQQPDGSTVRHDINLDKDKSGAQALFDEVLDNMDTTVVNQLGGGVGPAKQANRRILFNACLTNSNEVHDALSENRSKARSEIRKYIQDHASLATFMGTYAASKGTDVVSLGANASITQVRLIDNNSGQLDLFAPDDEKVTATKIVYMEHGTEPHGVLLAALEAWANDPAVATSAMKRRAKNRSTKWNEAVIEGVFELALKLRDRDDWGSILQGLAGMAKALNDLTLKDDCRVSTLHDIVDFCQADASWQEALVGRLAGTTTAAKTGKNAFTALVLAQVDAVDRGKAASATKLVDTLLPTFDAKTARDFLDVQFLIDGGLMSTAMAKTPTKGSILLALLGVLGPKPADCVTHLRPLLHPGAPLMPMLPEVPPVAPVPPGVGPRAEIPEALEVKGRPPVDAIPGANRDPVPAVADLAALPKLDAVAGPPPRKVAAQTATQATKGKGTTTIVESPEPEPTAPDAPGRPGRAGRPEAPEIAAVKAFFEDTHGITQLLAGRSTKAAIADLVKA